ncbi:hypothetical protein [Devosia faecipullorum]|uniref:hypothetical protein n=1 Tax=Devosia faecipullorum TaxID=2755039 RepID=UPI00187B76A6|nr:hypothetical protein [Devosia faecipullorum]MBE7732154.1 hypothetical protein [Devosia faecipullorum]
MLKTLLRSIRAMLAALPRFVTERVWDGVRWMSRLVAMPAPAMEPDPVDEDRQVLAAEEAAHMDALRTVAAHLAADGMPPEAALDALREFDIEWLTAMDRPMLCRIATASDAALKAHIRRTENIRGVLAHDRVAVAEYRAARRRRQEREDEELGLVPAMVM